MNEPASSTLSLHREGPEDPTPSLEGRASLVGECTRAEHPRLQGRVLVTWTDADGPQERWLPTLHGAVVREHDRVVLVHPANWDEPLVVGVVDGFEPRPEPPRQTGALLVLAQDEKITIRTADGEPLLELHQAPDGPCIRLLHEDVNLEIPGAFRVNAKSLELTARQGGVAISATDDVVVKGEFVKLN